MNLPGEAVLVPARKRWPPAFSPNASTAGFHDGGRQVKLFEIRSDLMMAGVLEAIHVAHMELSERQKCGHPGRDPGRILLLRVDILKIIRMLYLSQGMAPARLLLCLQIWPGGRRVQGSDFKTCSSDG